MAVEVIKITDRQVIWKADFSREPHFTLKDIFFKSMDKCKEAYNDKTKRVE